MELVLGHGENQWMSILEAVTTTTTTTRLDNDDYSNNDATLKATHVEHSAVMPSHN